MKDNNKAVTLVHILIIFGFVIASILISIFVIKNYSLSNKISKTINQHESIYRFIVAYQFMCKTSPANVLTFKTCAGNNSECKKGRIVTPGVTKISCSSKSVSAENVVDYFVMHFNENGYENYYNKKSAKIDENLKLCCLVKNSNPKKGQTYIYGDNKNNIIKITTNVGSKLSKDVYLTNTVDWPGKDFK
jgi:hypothetical protein